MQIISCRRCRCFLRVAASSNTQANRDLMSVLLDYGGHDATCVATMAEALAVARSLRPDLILCDMNLAHGQRGIEVLDAFMGDPELRDLRFVLTSATRGASVERDALHRGARAFLRLPMGPSALLREIGRLLA